MRRPNSLTLLVIAFVAAGFLAIWSHALGLTLFVFFGVAIVAVFAYGRYEPLHRARDWMVRARENALVVSPPFYGTWTVRDGGPEVAHNPLLGADDTLYAYRFIPVEGSAFACDVLAPCAGFIVHTETRAEDGAPDAPHRDERFPFGNYISIQVAEGYVLVTQLQSGSLRVRVGDSVRAGQVIASSGNSGDTNGSAIALHAQTQPSRSTAAVGIPLAFRVAHDAPMVLEYKDELAGPAGADG